MSSEVDSTFVRGTMKEIVIQNYMLYATLSLLIYDLAASLELEIKYFWNRHISPVAVLYFATRYGAILSTILQFPYNTFNANNGICRSAYFSDIVDAITIICVDYILLLRVRALYSQGKAISIVLFAAFGISAISGLVISIQGDSIEDSEALRIAPGLSLCVESDLSVVEGPVSWSIPLAYGALLLALALYKAAIIWKEVAGLKGVSLVKILIQDQALYFSAVILVSVASIVADVLEVSSLLAYVLNVVGNPVFLSILGARLLFNMKEAGEKGLNQGTSCPTALTLSDIDFAAPPASAAESSLGEGAGAEEVRRAVEAEIEEVV